MYNREKAALAAHCIEGEPAGPLQQVPGKPVWFIPTTIGSAQFNIYFTPLEDEFSSFFESFVRTKQELLSNLPNSGSRTRFFKDLRIGLSDHEVFSIITTPARN